MTERTRLFAANWKMNLEAAQVDQYLARFTAGLRESASNGIELAFYPSAIWLERLLRELTQVSSAGRSIFIGGQDLHPESAGAHTGDLSGEQLVSAGCTSVLCGHSERRQDHGEDDQLVAAKTEAALRVGLLPVVCVGESLEQREGGQTKDVLQRQVSTILETVLRTTETQQLPPIVIAYEPIWAIGTGRTATPDLAQDAHAAIRELIRTAAGVEAARATRLLYGGSVKPGNCEELIAEEDVDGFLIGGASLDPDSFLDIISRCG